MRDIFFILMSSFYKINSQFYKNLETKNVPEGANENCPGV